MKYFLLKADRSPVNESKSREMFGAICEEYDQGMSHTVVGHVAPGGMGTRVICYVPNQRHADTILGALNR